MTLSNAYRLQMSARAPAVVLLVVLAVPAHARQVFEEHQLTRVSLDPVDTFAMDFDSDGDDDVVSLSRSDGVIRLLENLGGTNFVEREGLIGVEPGVVYGGSFDVDGDGRPDLVLATEGGPLVLWRNEIAPLRWTRSVLDTGAFADATAFDGEDFNGDGVVDLVVRFADEIGWLPSLGGGAIGPYIRIASAASRGLQLVDVDGNGVRDIISIRSGPVTEWWEADGSGGFTHASSSHGFAAGTFEDLDNDGVIDVLALEQIDVVGFGSYANYRAHWRRGLGGGMFAPFQDRGLVAQYMCVSWGLLPSDVRVVASPDFSGDGFPEILVDCSCGSAFPPSFRDAISTGAATWAEAYDLRYVRPRRADVDGDGDWDALWVGPAAPWSELVPGPMYSAQRDLIDRVGWLDRPTLADLNHDGWPDVVATPAGGEGLAVFDGVGNGQFADARLQGGLPVPPSIHPWRRRHTADIDGDGWPDVAYNHDDDFLVWRSGDGAGSFGPENFIASGTAGSRLRGIGLGDFDGDGNIDIVGSDFYTALVLWRGLGGGSFGPAEYFWSPALPRLEVGDLEGDGDLDVVSYHNLPTTGLTIHEWTGNGFAPAVHVPAARPRDAALADLDDDGDLDAAYVGDGQLEWARNDHPLGWASSLPLPNPGGYRAESVAAGDVDGDGKVDLVVGYSVSSTGGGALGYLLQGPGGFAAPVFSDTPAVLWALRLADVDADGDLDALGAGRNHVAWLENHFDHALPIGTRYCTPAIPNSTGFPGAIRARGSVTLAQRDLTIVATSLPRGSAGFFLASQAQGLTFPVFNSQGRVCLGGSIGRYVGPGQVQNSGQSGSFELVLDLAAMPTPSGPITALPGSTWHFQAWHRDANPMGTSNFTDAVSVTFE